MAFGELIEQLQETLKEREMVIAAVKSGVAGPYKFERFVWEQIALLGALWLGMYERAYAMDTGQQRIRIPK